MTRFLDAITKYIIGKVGRVVNDDDDTHVFFYREKFMPSQYAYMIDGLWIKRLSAEPALTKCRKEGIEIEQVPCIALFKRVASKNTVIIDRLDTKKEVVMPQNCCPPNLVARLALELRSARQEKITKRTRTPFLADELQLFCRFKICAEEIDVFEPEELD